MAVTIDISGFTSKMDDVMDRLAEIPDYVEDYIESAVIPTLEAEAASQRNVRTGTYAGTWEVESDDDSVSVTTDAYYWPYLEYGTSRGIQPKAVVGVAVDQIKTELPNYIIQALDLSGL